MNLCRTKIRQPKKPYACGIAPPIKHCQKGEDREENYQGRKTLSAKFKATSPDGELEFRFTFDYGNEAKEGYTIDSSNSLFSIDVTYIGRIAPNLRKNINSGSSYTLEHLISHPLIFLDEHDISLKYKDAYKKLEKTHDQQSWKLENYKGRYIYLRSKGSNNKISLS